MNFITQFYQYVSATCLRMIKTVAKVVVIWNIVLFFPVIIILYQIKFAREIIDSILKFVDLFEKKNLFQRKVTLLKLWVFTFFKYFLRIFSKTFKYPFGYAILKENGKYLQSDSPHIFNYQLYNYMVRKFMYLQSLSKKTILEIECGEVGGIEFIASTLNPQKCFAINSKESIINELKKNNTNKKVVYSKGKIEDIKSMQELNKQKFDCILAINTFANQEINHQNLLELKKYLNKDGYICIGEYMQNDFIRYFEEIISRDFKITKSDNISKNVIHAIKLQIKNQQLQTGYIERLKNRFLEYFEDEKTKIMGELQSKKKFILYILQPHDN